jgi:Protein of unknown function (DUF2752)
MSFPPSKGAALNARQIRTRIVFALVCPLIISVSFLKTPWLAEGPVLCPVRFLWGLPCPSCGLTRSFCAVSRGDLLGALQFHLFGPLLYVGCALAVFPLTLEVFRQQQCTWLHRVLFSRRCICGAAWLLMIYHGFRLMHILHMGQVLPALESSTVGVAWQFVLRQFGIGCMQGDF